MLKPQCMCEEGGVIKVQTQNARHNFPILPHTPSPFPRPPSRRLLLLLRPPTYHPSPRWTHPHMPMLAPPQPPLPLPLPLPLQLLPAPTPQQQPPPPLSPQPMLMRRRPPPPLHPHLPPTPPPLPPPQKQQQLLQQLPPRQQQSPANQPSARQANQPSARLGAGGRALRWSKSGRPRWLRARRT